MRPDSQLTLGVQKKIGDMLVLHKSFSLVVARTPKDDAMMPPISQFLLLWC